MDRPTWHEETQTLLKDLRDSSFSDFQEWLWYCRERLNLDPNIVPPIYLENWLKLPIERRSTGY